jgi:Uma2 family endonuclease
MQTVAYYTIDEYFEILSKSDMKLEYNGGLIVELPGTCPTHNIIAVNVGASMGLWLKTTDFIMYGSQQLIRVQDCDKYTFPDLVIVCEKPVYEKSPGGLDALLNPEIIIEVLSDSTETYDRLEKFDCYKTIPSFREYVMVSSKMKKIEVVKKLSEAEWLSHTYAHKDETILIDECLFSMADIYNKVEFA